MRRLLLTFALLFAFIAPALSKDFTREEIEQIVREFIEKNPQVMIDSVEKYGQSQQAADDEAASGRIRQNMDWLVKNAKHAEAGNPKGDVTIVEFFDYNCGYCKQAMSDVMTLLDADKRIRLIFVEIPILGESSYEAARWAMAAMPQKKYLEYHIALMRHKGPLNEGAFVDYAQKAGLNIDQLRKDKLNPQINVDIDDNLRMARLFGIQGTPAFIVGDQLVRGYVGIDGLREAVEAARKKAKK